MSWRRLTSGDGTKVHVDAFDSSTLTISAVCFLGESISNMVNFSSFGPLTGGKNATFIASNNDQNTEKTCRMKLIGVEETDIEANMTTFSLNDRGNNHRGKSGCMAFAVDACAVVALVLLVVSMACVLYKVWWVKSEVDQIAPVVAKLAADISRLKADSVIFQAHNSAFVGILGRESDTDVDKADQLEDVSDDALNQLSDELQQQMEVVNMVFRASATDSPALKDTDNNNITEFYNLYVDAVNGVNSAEHDEEPDILHEKQFVNNSGLLWDPSFSSSILSKINDEDDSTQEGSSSERKSNVDIEDDDDDASSDDDKDDSSTKKIAKNAESDSDNDDSR